MKANQRSEPMLGVAPFGDTSVHEALATEITKSWRAEVYRDYSVLELAWRQLEKNGHCTVFQGYDYAAALYDAASSTGAAEPLIVVVSKEGGGIAWILPLCISRNGKLKVISFADLGLADYAAPVIAPLCRSVTLSVFKNWPTRYKAFKTHFYFYRGCINFLKKVTVFALPNHGRISRARSCSVPFTKHSCGRKSGWKKQEK